MSTDPIDEALVPIARRAEEIARQMALESGVGEGAWEAFLIDAYDELLPFEIGEDDDED